MTFLECVHKTCAFPGFIENYDRLHNTTFARLGSLDAMIDEGTGKQAKDVAALVEFIRERIWPYVESQP